MSLELDRWLSSKLQRVDINRWCSHALTRELM